MFLASRSAIQDKTEVKMLYLDQLRSNAQYYQTKIETLMEKYFVQPVGSGYIDLITSLDFVEKFIEELTSLGIAIEGITWWCHCSPENSNHYRCPHGMGGPLSRFFDGWFSEMQIPMYEYAKEKHKLLAANDGLSDDVRSINEAALQYMRNFQGSEQYIQCLYPAVWLLVPDEW